MFKYSKTVESTTGTQRIESLDSSSSTGGGLMSKMLLFQ